MAFFILWSAGCVFTLWLWASGVSWWLVISNLILDIALLPSAIRAFRNQN